MNNKQGRITLQFAANQPFLFPLNISGEIGEERLSAAAAAAAAVAVAVVFCDSLSKLLSVPNLQLDIH